MAWLGAAAITALLLMAASDLKLQEPAAASQPSGTPDLATLPTSADLLEPGEGVGRVHSEQLSVNVEGKQILLERKSIELGEGYKIEVLVQMPE